MYFSVGQSDSAVKQCSQSLPGRAWGRRPPGPTGGSESEDASAQQEQEDGGWNQVIENKGKRETTLEDDMLLYIENSKESTPKTDTIRANKQG